LIRGRPTVKNISLIKKIDSEKCLLQSQVVFQGENVMSTESATQNLVYTSYTNDANFSMQLSVGPYGQVTPPEGGKSVPGWQIISGRITFEAPGGRKISQPINGTDSQGKPIPGQCLVAGSGFFGIGSPGLSIGGGALNISSPCIDGTQGYYINYATPGGVNIRNIKCTPPWPPGGG
jgi:hypothetical protein